MANKSIKAIGVNICFIRPFNEPLYFLFLNTSFININLQKKDFTLKLFLYFKKERLYK